MARRKPPEGFGRLAAALASSDEAAPRMESRLLRLTVTTRWVTIGAGFIFGVLRHSGGHFALATVALVVFGAIQTFHQMRPSPNTRIKVLVVLELCLTVTACTITGGLRQPLRAHTGHRAAPRRLGVGPPGRGRHGDRRSHRGRSHDRDAVDRRHRPALGRTDRGRLLVVRRARRIHAQPDRGDREPTGSRDRSGRRDGHGQRRWSPSTRSRRRSRRRSTSARSSTPCGSVCARCSDSARSWCSCETTRNRSGPSSSPKASGSRRTSRKPTCRSRSNAPSRAPARS